VPKDLFEQTFSKYIQGQIASASWRMSSWKASWEYRCKPKTTPSNRGQACGYL